MGDWKIEKLGDLKIERFEKQVQSSSPMTNHLKKRPILTETFNPYRMRYIFGLMFVALSQLVLAQKQEEAFSVVDEMLVFSEPSVESSVSLRIKKFEVFLIQIDQDANSDWLAIELPSNRFSTYSDKSEKQFSVGFVQKSMIKMVKDLERYALDDVVLSFQIVKAVQVPANRWVYGLEIPLEMSYAVRQMTLEWKNSEISVDHSHFDDLFNVTFSEGRYSSRMNDKFNFYKHNDVFFVKQVCGDGASTYEITWVIENGFIMQRIIDEI